MKSSFRGVALLFMVLLAGGCTKYVTEKPVTYVNGSVVSSYYIKTLKDRWLVPNNVEPGKEGYCAFQSFEFPEIDKNVIENGVVLVYYIDVNGRDNMLPFMLPYGQEGYCVYENYRFDVEEGVLTIIIESSDFQFVDRDSDLNFKVVVIQP